MADKVSKVQYVYVTVSNKPGQGAAILGALRKAKVNLLAFSGFPARAGKAQVDLVTDDLPALRKAAKAGKWKLSPAKRGFLVQGRDRIGAVAGVFTKLSEAKINVTAADAVTAGQGRYGMLFWVKPASYARAARILKAK